MSLLSARLLRRFWKALFYEMLTRARARCAALHAYDMLDLRINLVAISDTNFMKQPSQISRNHAYF